MQRIHFIAIGGPVLHSIAIASSKKNNFTISGSDIEISEPAFSRLKLFGLLPEKLGWFPEKIVKGISAVIIGKNVRFDNPEVLKAKELGLKIFTYPEFMYVQTRSKTRIVVGGSFGKTTITAMIVFVLKHLRIDADYMLSAHIEGFDDRVKLSYDSRIAVFEGDENLISPIDCRPKFHIYKPHIAVLSCIDSNSKNYFSTEEEYVALFQKFTDLMEVQGRLIYYEGDENLNEIASKLRRDIVPFTYKTPENEIVNGVTLLKTKKGNIPLQVSGIHNLQNIEAARIACRQIGVTDDQFYSVIAKFTGISI